MNVKIKSLYERALVAAGKEKKFDTTDMDVVNEFAKLLVYACAEFAVVQQADRDVRNIVSENPARDFAYSLIDHFGVNNEQTS